MTKLIHRFVTAAITVSVGIVAAFTLWFAHWSSAKGNVKTDELSSLQTLNVKSATPQPSPINPADLEVVKRFAESYEPKSTKNEVIPPPPCPNEKVVRALKALAESQTREHEKYIVLMFLRLYRFYIEHFQQSYNLESIPDNPLTLEFFRLAKLDYQKDEDEQSSVAADWVDRNPQLLDYALIKKEMIRIDKASKRNKKEFEKAERRGQGKRKN